MLQETLLLTSSNMNILVKKEGHIVDKCQVEKFVLHAEDLWGALQNYGAQM